MIREVKEETGLTIKNPYLCGLYHWYKHSIHNIILVYKASEYEGKLHSSDEGRFIGLIKKIFKSATCNRYGACMVGYC